MDEICCARLGSSTNMSKMIKIRDYYGKNPNELVFKLHEPLLKKHFVDFSAVCRCNVF